MTDNTPISTPEPATGYQLTTDAEINTHNAARTAAAAANHGAAKLAANRAAAARAELAQTPNGAAMLVHIDAIRTGKPDPTTVELAAAIGEAERSAEATAEAYSLDAAAKWAALAGLTMNLPFCAELQKISADIRYRLAGLHMVNAAGEKPSAETVNPDGCNLLTSVSVYSASRPHTRFVLGPSHTFASVTAQLAEDVHCDFAEQPYASKLLAHKRIGNRDCIIELAEAATRWRTQHDYYTRQMDGECAPEHRHKLVDPGPLNVGVMLAVAFSNDIVVVKICHGHVLALLDKYGIDPAHCGIFEPWEGVGNYW